MKYDDYSILESELCGMAAVSEGANSNPISNKRCISLEFCYSKSGPCTRAPHCVGQEND